MEIKISTTKDGLFRVETETQRACRLMWHEMVTLVARMTEPEGPECLVWLKDKNDEI